MKPLPPEPEWDGKHWWYRNAQYFKAEAFREYNDDRAQALRERIVELVEIVGDLRHRLDTHVASRGATHWDGCDQGHNDCALSKRATAILAKLNKEGLA